MTPRDAGARWLVWIAACLMTGNAAAVELRLDRMEAVGLTASAASGQTTHLQLSRRTQQLELVLEPDRDLLPGGRLGTTQALQGRVLGRAGSWARLTRRDGRYQGVFSDGKDVYVLERAAALQGIHTPAAALDPETRVIYRLADLQVIGAFFEGDTTGVVRSAADTLGIVGAEIALGTTPLLPTKRLDVGVLADTELVAADGTALDANIADRLAVTDGIFASQVGVRIRLANLTRVDSAADGLTSSDPNTLLDQVGAYRKAHSAQQAFGVTHLLTGRSLTGTTIGVAYLGAVCSRNYGASLTRARTSIAVDGLAMAHELGHLFGAPHDGDAAYACAATPETFLMAPRMNGSSTFSACSLQQMSPVVSSASCLAQVDAPDVSLSVPTSTALVQGKTATLTFTVRSSGNATVTGVSVTAAPPAGVTLDSGTAAGAACTANGASLRCTLGDMASGVSQDVQLGLRSSIVGTSQLALQLAASNDSISANNQASLALVTEAGADLAASLSGDGRSVTTGTTTSLHVTLQNLGASAAPDAMLVMGFPTGVTPVAVLGSSPACTVSAGTLSCTPLALAANAQAALDVTVRVDQTGSLPVTATLKSASVADPQSGNNSATATLTGTAPPPSQGGGGSGTGLVGLLALLLGWRRLRYWPVFEK